MASFLWGEMNKRTIAESFEVLNRAATPVVMRMLRRFPNDVEDTLQNTAMNAIRFCADFNETCELKTWYIAIAIRESLMTLRRHRNLSEPCTFLSPEILDTIVRKNSPTPERVAMWAETKEKLVKGIMLLSPKLRREMLRYVVGKHENSNAGKARRFRARQQLKEFMAA
jgi:DNA-directed RNA polymerase specialized sigma24 family protein